MAHVKIRTCRPISTLKSLCEKVAAEHLVEPRNAVQLLEIADSLGAEDLRKHCEIQAEQSKTKGIQSAKSKGQVEDASDSKSGVKIHISSFLPSNPIPVISAQTSQVSEGERSTPPWIASGTPPVHSRPSLRDIQMQQGKHHPSLSHSPKARTTEFTIATGQGSPSHSAGLNHWFKPEVDTPSSIRSIQIEERAIKDLKCFNSSVKILKNQS